MALNSQARTPEAVLRQLEFSVLKRLDGLLQGDYRTWSRGQGVDLAGLREYQPHDDVRHIDWNVTARLDEPHVRCYVEDRDLTAWFLLDATASLQIETGHSTKLELASGFVGTLARVLTRHGNRVGAVRYSGQVDAVLPPKATRTQVLHLLAALQAPIKPAAQPQGTHLADLLRRAAPLVRRRSLVFVVSDFVSAPGWEQPLAQLAQRHDVVAVRLGDGMDTTLPAYGLVTLQDAETGEQFFVDAADPAFRQRYAQAAQAEEAARQQALMQSGADTLELSTEEDLLQALLRFAAMRRQRARLRPHARGPLAAPTLREAA
jgi:uncharacterized protein (DUF58 family)